MTRQVPEGGLSRSESCLVAINGGSSSLKFAVFSQDGVSELSRIRSGRIERIGLPNPRFFVEGASISETPVDAPDLKSAALFLMDWLGREIGHDAIKAVGHRIVHGGSHCFAPQVVTRELIDELRRLIPMDPNHLSGEIALLEVFRENHPSLIQVACFDTAFHHAMPRVAQIVPIPRRFEALGVRRYGFHGLSYSYLMQELAAVAGTRAAKGRVILAHLGSGASLAAVHEGQCVDTTMGFTPCSGLVMSTRTGDIDPGLPAFLARTEKMTPEAFDQMVNHESGLLGVSETSPDLRDLIAKEHDDVRAAEAVSLFCYQAKKAIGAMTAALGGLETLVFSGGIGENSPVIRKRIVDGLEYLGVTLDDSRNSQNAAILSSDASRVVVRMIPTDEEIMIARAVSNLL